MSLDWDVTKCKNSKALTSDEEWPVTQALIWLTMGTGIGNISKTNAPEFYARIHLLEQLDGTWLQSIGEEGTKTDRPITPEDVCKRIGMKTNVFPMETRAKWLKRVSTRVFDKSIQEFILKEASIA